MGFISTPLNIKTLSQNDDAYWLRLTDGFTTLCVRSLAVTVSFCLSSGGATRSGLASCEFSSAVCSLAQWRGALYPVGWSARGDSCCLSANCLGVFKGTITPSTPKGKILNALGIIYLIGMCARLLVGLTIAPDHYWFSARLPTVFHLVLASFVILYGRFHLKNSQLSSSRHRYNPT